LAARQADAWFDDVLKLPGARILFVSKRIALEAAKVPAILGSGDPGDCFLIATARVKKIPIVTRDATMHALAAANPGYIRTIRC
jgi:PIN domain nuclease of toxin-antitoxin system